MAGAAALLAIRLLVPQDDLERIVEKIEKAYAPIRSILCQFEVDTSPSEVIYRYAPRRVHQLRIVRDRYQAADVFTTVWNGETKGAILSVSIVQQGDHIFEKTICTISEEQLFVTAKKARADMAVTKSSYGEILTEMGVSDLGLVSAALQPRALLRQRNRVYAGRESIEGRDYDTLEVSSTSGIPGLGRQVRYYIDASTGRFAFIECVIAMERVRFEIQEHQEIAGVPFPKVIRFQPMGETSDGVLDGYGSPLTIRVLAANSDEIPQEPPAWTSDPALPDLETGDFKELLRRAKENPKDPLLQLRAINALLNEPESLLGAREGVAQEAIERLRSAQSDSPLIAELACALLAASDRMEEFDARIAAIAAKGPLPPGLAVLRLKSFFERNRAQDGLMAYEACLGDPFARACAADYELPLRVRAAPSAAAVAKLVDERTRGLEWPAKLRVLDQIESTPPRVIAGIVTRMPSRSAFSELPKDILARISDGFPAPELRVLLARSHWKAAGGASRAAEAYLAAVAENPAAFDALRGEMARFATAHPVDDFVERLARSDKVETVEFLTSHARKKLQEGDPDAAAASIESAIAHLAKGARLVDPMADFADVPDPAVSKLLQELMAIDRAPLARRLLIAAAGSSRNSLLLWISDHAADGTRIFQGDKAEAYRFACALDPDATISAFTHLGLTPKDVRKAAEASLRGSNPQIADARHLASLIREVQSKGEAESLAMLVARAAEVFPQDYAAAAAAGDAWRVAGDSAKAAEYYRRAIRLRPEEDSDSSVPGQEEDDDPSGPVRRLVGSNEGRQQDGRLLRLPVLVKLADSLRTWQGKERALAELETWIAAHPKERDQVEGARALDHLGESKRAFDLMKAVFLGPLDRWNDRAIARARADAAGEMMRIAAANGDAAGAYIVAHILSERQSLRPSAFSVVISAALHPAIELAHQILCQHVSDDGEAKLLDAFWGLPAPEPSAETAAAARLAVERLAAPFLEEREAAFETLHDLGPAAAPFLRDAIRSQDPEVKRRARLLVRPWAVDALRRSFEANQ